MWTRSSRSGRRRLSLAALALGVLCAPGVARANPDCSSLPSPIYGIGGSSHQPLIAKFAAVLAGQTSPVTVVYQAPGACNGINALLGSTTISGTATYWDTSAVAHTCNLPTAGQAVTFANMGITATSCPGVASLPSTIGDFPGPISAYELVVPLQSSQQSISAEGVYFVYGFGATGQASPWTDETQIIKRDQNSAATVFISLATGVPALKFHGVDGKSNTGVVTAVSTAATPEKAIGYLSSDVADANRATVRPLAYQHFGQSCGYWADSTATTFDKANVRDGQYELWGATHFFAAIDNTGKVTDANTKTFIDYVTLATALPAPGDGVKLQIASGNIPTCAMHVKRTTDLGPVQSYLPAAPCGCYFDKLATGSTTCATCASNADCPSSAPTCRNSFCEVR